jgi:hypothetical protein
VRTSSATIVGAVFDSMAMLPLADAVVQLAQVPRPGQVGLVRSTRADTSGRYSFSDVAPGTYLLGFQHIALDSLGLRGAVHRVDVRSAGAVRVALAIPSLRSMVTTVCGPQGVKDSVAVLVGSVRNALSDAPVPGSFISFRWGEIYLSRSGNMQRETPIVDVYANEDGFFRACVPGGVPILTRATRE